MYNFSFLDLFEDNDDIIEKISKFEATKLQTLLYSFANMIDDIGIDESVKKVSTLLWQKDDYYLKICYNIIENNRSEKWK